MSLLEVTIAGVKYPAPSFLASGILGSSASLLKRVLESGAGAAVTKSVTVNPRKGHPNPCFIELEVGYVNSLGLPNPGYLHLLEEIKRLDEKNRVVVSLAGSSIEEFTKMAEAVEDAGFMAVELNFSCPHVKSYGLELSKNKDVLVKSIKEIKEVTRLKVWVKLGLCDNIVELAKFIEKAGGDAIVAINTVRCIIIDIYAKRPYLSSIYGGLSGKAIHPIAVRCVYDLFKEVDLPIIGVGGIEHWKDAVEMLLAGASAVQVGSAIAKKGLNVFTEINRGLENYLRENGFKSIKSIVGLAHKR